MKESEFSLYKKRRKGSIAFSKNPKLFACNVKKRFSSLKNNFLL